MMGKGTEKKQFLIQTDTYEGPLDLLLSLIEKKKLFISDISLARVADDYIQHIKNFEHFPTKDVAHFILIASTLVLIKSRSLLPDLALTPEEQHSIEDLEKRLREYKRIKELGKHIALRFGKAIMFPVSAPRLQEVKFMPDERITVSSLHQALRDVLVRIPKEAPMAKAVVQKVISLEEMITDLTARIQNNLKMSFKSFAQKGEHGREEKAHLIVGFLAMLELVKQGIIAVQQHTAFEDIEMESKETTVPNYS